MLETLANLGEFLVAIAVALSLIYVGYQLNATRRQLKLNATLERLKMRISIWENQIDREAFGSAQDKFFEHELYRRDACLQDLEELSLHEVRATRTNWLIEMTYALMLFHQKRAGFLEEGDTTQLLYLRYFSSTPLRREWKDIARLHDVYPRAFVVHVDGIVKKFDAIEKRMESDQDADYESLIADVFEVPAPPPWID